MIILDGWGLSPSWGGNAIAMNNPQFINTLWREYPHKILLVSLEGKTSKVIGDSRLGHSTIAAGRRVPQDLEIIDTAIEQKTFYKNPVLKGAFSFARKHHCAVHLLGMISDGGIHSHVRHLLALLEMAHRENFREVFIDAITDGTDSGPMDAIRFIKIIKEKIQRLGIGKFSSLVGRALAMDRDHHWDKTIQVYEMLVEGKGKIAESAEKAVTNNYRKGLTDEFVEPTLIMNGKSTTTIKENDVVIFFNYREDRARQLTEIFVNPSFRRFFWRPKIPKNILFTTFTRYAKNLNTQVVFPREPLPDILPEILAKYQKRDLRVAESEKYAHVTYFFNCGREEPFAFEERKIFSSPAVDSYDTTPKMSGAEITEGVLAAISSKKYDFILVNFANVDLIAHTGNIIAAGRAVLEVDKFVKKIVERNLNSGVTIITADHGNVEQMLKIKDAERETRHTYNPVPFMLIRGDLKKNLIQGAFSTSTSTLAKIISAKNTLSDIAPTILELMGLPRPEIMTGHSLLNKLE